MWGIYNLPSSGETSWYKFAFKIIVKIGYNSKSKLIPINSKDYSAVADRLLNLRLDNSKIFNLYGIKLLNWENSFHNFFKKIPRNLNENIYLEHKLYKDTYTSCSAFFKRREYRCYVSTGNKDSV